MPSFMRIVIDFLFRWRCSRRHFSLPIPPPLSLVITCRTALSSRIPIFIRFFIHSAACLCSELSSVAYWMAPNTQALRPLRKIGNPLCRRELCLYTSPLTALA